MIEQLTDTQPVDKRNTTQAPVIAPVSAGAVAGVGTGRTVRRTQQNDEIDLIKVFQAIRRRILLIIILGLLFGCSAAAVTAFFITPLYTSTSKMLVLSKETTISSLADLQIGSQLTRDYTILIQSRPVLAEVIDNLDLEMGYQALRGKLSVRNPSDSRILEISIVDPDPYLAKKMVDEVSYVSSDYISEKMEVSAPNIIEEGEIPRQKTSPNMRKNVKIGILMGVLLACAIAVIEDLMNDAITTEEDVEKYLGLVTLVSVPEKGREKGDRKKRKKVKRTEAKRV